MSKQQECTALGLVKGISVKDFKSDEVSQNYHPNTDLQVSTT